MTRIIAGSDLTLFNNKDEIVTHLLKNIMANKNKKVGTEWEMFFIDKNGKAISRAGGQKAFEEFKNFFRLNGYKSSYVFEQDAGGKQTIFGLEIEGLGLITPEMGHQFEFSATVSENDEEVAEKNEEFYRGVYEVSKRLNYTPVFVGHIPGYVENTEGSYRSRSQQWRNYFDHRFGSQSMLVREALDATASTQVTVDSGADKFHEYFQALLLIEPAFTLYFANSDRPHISVHRLPAAHMRPIIGAWHTKTPREAVAAVVDRLMGVEVPFLPDPEYPEIYKAEAFIGNRPPTMEDLMHQGRLNEKTLNNAGGFLLSRPAIRRFSQGLLEMRGVDSQADPKSVTEVAQRVVSIVYDDEVRQKLLADYAYLSAMDIQALHDASAMASRKEAAGLRIVDMSVADFVSDIMERSQKGVKPIIRKDVFSGVEAILKYASRR